MDVLVAVVGYGNTGASYRTVESVQTAAGSLGPDCQLSIIFVQNDAKAATIEMFISLAAQVRCRTLASARNLGYLGGAVSALASHGAMPDWLVVTNADVVFPREFFRILRAGESGYGLLGPQIFDAGLDGRILGSENPYYWRAPGPYALLRSFVIASSRLSLSVAVTAKRWKRTVQVRMARIENGGVGPVEMRREEEGPTAAGGRDVVPVYAIHGSCFAVSKELLVQSRLLAEHPFLYGEELYLAEQCRRSGLLAGFAPNVGVWHRAHVSTGRMDKRMQVKLLRSAALKALSAEGERLLGRLRARAGTKSRSGR